MDTVTWVLLVAAGFGVMQLIPRVHAKLEPWFERIGALLFTGAGVVGATGWVGDVVGWLSNVVPNFADMLGNRVVGTNIMWLIIAAVALLWLGAFLPRNIIAYDYPDWLVISGFFLPIMINRVPGWFGESLGSLIQFGGDAAVAAVSSLVG